MENRKWYLVYTDFGDIRPPERNEWFTQKIALDVSTEEEAIKAASSKWHEVLRDRPQETEHFSGQPYPSNPRVVHEIPIQ